MKKKSLLLSVCFLALLVVGSNSSVFAQEESSASLEETTGWITDVLREYRLLGWVENQHGEKSNFGFYYSKAKSDSCTLKYHRERELYDGNIIPSKLEIALSDLDPVSTVLTKVEVDKIGLKYVKPLSIISLKTTNNKPLIKELNWDQKLYNWGKTEIVFDDNEMAKRFLKAVKHGIKLCGGKVAPF